MVDHKQTVTNVAVYCQYRGLEKYARELMNAADELSRLEAIVAKLPKVWRLNDAGGLVQDYPLLPDSHVYAAMHNLTEIHKVRVVHITTQGWFAVGGIHGEDLLNIPECSDSEYAPQYCNSEAAAAAALAAHSETNNPATLKEGGEESPTR